MKKNRESHMALFFVIGTAVLAVFFFMLAYMLLFRMDLVLPVLRYTAALLSAVIGVAFAMYTVKLIRRFLHM